MRLGTVWIRNKKTGQKRKINAIDYATDLGKSRYVDWELISESKATESESMVSGESVGVSTKVAAEELEVSEQVSGEESPRVKAAQTRRRKRQESQTVEVKDKGSDE